MARRQAAADTRNTFAIPPPIEPMLAKITDAIPAGDFLYEPKWDGFRAIVFRGTSDVFLQSRDLRPFDRYFPDLHEIFLRSLPKGCVVDGEIVIVSPKGLDFDALQMRLHPAASRVAKLAAETPAAFVAFDLLAAGERDLRQAPQHERRAQLEQILAGVEPPIHLTPVSRDQQVATEWLARFEGAGLDGVIVNPLNNRYEPGERTMFKVKHARTADCVVAGSIVSASKRTQALSHGVTRCRCVPHATRRIVRRDHAIQRPFETHRGRTRDVSTEDGDIEVEDWTG